jgi:hypothetical protein
LQFEFIVVLVQGFFSAGSERAPVIKLVEAGNTGG